MKRPELKSDDHVELPDSFFGAPDEEREHTMTKPLILVDPLPRTIDLICDEKIRRKFESLGQVVVHDSGPMPDEMVDRFLPEAVILVGQTPMKTERLKRARKLKVIINVETNFTDNIDYEYCFANGIYVLARGSALRTPSPNPLLPWRSILRTVSRKVTVTCAKAVRTMVLTEISTVTA